MALKSWEHLLVVGAEEAIEVAMSSQAVAKTIQKALRFGLDSISPVTQQMTIIQLVSELNDLEAAIEMLREAGVPLVGLHDREAIDAKKEKVKRLMRLVGYREPDVFP